VLLRNRYGQRPLLEKNISYRRADSASVVGRISSELKKHFPTQDVFLDHDRISLVGNRRV